MWVQSRCRQLQTLATALIAECGPREADPRLTETVGDRFLTRLRLGPLTTDRNRWVQVDSDLMQWCRFLVQTALKVSEDPLDFDSLATMTSWLCGRLRLMPPRPRACVLWTWTALTVPGLVRGIFKLR